MNNKFGSMKTVKLKMMIMMLMKSIISTDMLEKTLRVGFQYGRIFH